MQEKRRRIIKQEGDVNTHSVSDETEAGERELTEDDSELLAAVSYKLNESAILIRNILAKSDGGHSEMELDAFVDALVAFEIAGENPKQFVEARSQYFAKPEAEEEVEE